MPRLHTFEPRPCVDPHLLLNRNCSRSCRCLYACTLETVPAKLTFLLAAAHSKDYLHNTKIPTYHFQDSLPRLPIPALEKTAERYIYAATPLISESELKTTKMAMDEFVKGPGAKLHQSIVERDKATYSSFISKPWFDMYLDTRSPLILNINPQITFAPDPNTAKMSQARSKLRVMGHSGVLGGRTRC